MEENNLKQNMTEIDKLLENLNIENKPKDFKISKVYILSLSLTHGNTCTNNLMRQYKFIDEDTANYYGNLITENYKKKYADDNPYTYFSVHENTIDVLYCSKK